MKKRVRLPISTAILAKLPRHWDQLVGPEKYQLWAVASLCFFGFFRLGELLPGPRSGGLGLVWGDVAIDSTSAHAIIRVFLRFSKYDQAGKGANVFIGRTNDELCPVAAAIAYMAVRGSSPGPFFYDARGRCC